MRVEGGHQKIISKRSAAKCIHALVALPACGPSLVRGGSFHTEDRYNPQHIDGLPPDFVPRSIAGAAIQKRSILSPATQPDSKRIVLHFEHFVCDGDGSYCIAAGCLHQFFCFRRQSLQALAELLRSAGRVRKCSRLIRVVRFWQMRSGRISA
jgi:hypothetical protein